MPAYLLRGVEPQGLSYEARQKAEKRLTDEIDSCIEVGSSLRNKMKKFMVETGIWSLSKIDYEARCSYEEYLKHDISASAICIYMLGFDRIKLHSLEQQAQTLSGRQNLHKYQNQHLFLRYHPDTEIGRKFLRNRDMESLLWDFQREAPQTLKKQIFSILHRVIQKERMDSIKEELDALKALYNFCTTSDIPDIEYLEEEQLQEFHEQLKKAGLRKGNIVDISRKILFLDAPKINWKANV